MMPFFIFNKKGLIVSIIVPINYDNLAICTITQKFRITFLSRLRKL